MNIRKHLLRLLGSALTMLGFSSCILVPAMYGSPHADFSASGTVTDTQGNAIEGIRVAVQQHRHYANSDDVIYDQNDWYENDTLFTNAQGQYSLTRSAFAKPTDVTIVFEDVDGPANGGEYESLSVSPEVVQTKKGDRSWYGGAFEVSADVTLENK
ncbi:MAG: radical SAM-associated putative lipoprotein [Bacteroidales bacterium]|nr:radical SAM-associated putative lipoprotein [Bacteroidales bacterium]